MSHVSCNFCWVLCLVLSAPVALAQTSDPPLPGPTPDASGRVVPSPPPELPSEVGDALPEEPGAVPQQSDPAPDPTPSSPVLAPLAGLPPEGSAPAPGVTVFVRQSGRSVVPETPDQRDCIKDPPHHGFFYRFTVGGGMGTVGGGDLLPKPGFKPIYGLRHSSPVLSLAVQLGGGSKNFALAAELFYEQMLERVESPSPVGFRLIGLGLAASYYFEHDWFLTGHLRWVGLIMRMADCPCFFNQLESASGPGVGLSLGKEWFSRSSHASSGSGWDRQGKRRSSSIGFAIQGNYARFDGFANLDYASGVILLSLSHF